MSAKKNTPRQTLRERAEALYLEKSSRGPGNPLETSPEYTEKLVHELRVHQVELEMQNEELRNVQTRLEAAWKRYVDLYDLAPVGYITLNEKGQILEVNLTAAAMLGVSRSVLVKQPVTRFIAKEDQDIYYLHRKKLFDGGERQSCELRMTKTDGASFWARLEATVAAPSTAEPDAAPDSGGVQICRIIMSDITERKRNEESLQNAQKLESLGVLAGGIAHDFNNLMGGIFGYMDLALQKSIDRQVSSYLAKALATMDRARGLTRQLLTFSTGGAPVRDIGQLFPFVQETTQFALSGSSVSCSFNVSEKLRPCNFDKSQIGQVVDNIVINAQQSMPDGGTIEVSAENISFGEKRHHALAAGDYVKISIKDHGVGILHEILPRIFDPFYTTKAKGHGLGLATCYSIVSKHGGCIDVESESGKGSTFHVFLPACAETVSDCEKKPAAKHTGSGTFLVMDDEEVIRDALCDMLESLGYAAVCKENGRQAIDFVASETKANRTIVGMVFDLTVAGAMGGKEAVGEIRKLCPDTPVFVASGYTEDPVMSNPQKYGFTASIGKPFRKSELSEMLEKHMKKQS